jgi:hypothetical protein
MSDETKQGEESVDPKTIEEIDRLTGEEQRLLAMPIPELVDDCIHLIERSEPIHTSVFLRLKTIFSKAMNNSTCPCESGKNYANCCKVDWTIIQRSVSSFKTEQKEEVKEEAKAGLVDRVNWICKCGIHKDTGAPVVMPVDDGRKMHSFGVANLLLDSYNHVNNQTMVETIHIVIQQKLEQMMKSGRPSKPVQLFKN